VLQEYQSILRKILERVDKKTVEGGGSGDGGGAHPAPGAAPRARRSRRRAPPGVARLARAPASSCRARLVVRQRCRGGVSRLSCARACRVQGRCGTSGCVRRGHTFFGRPHGNRGALPCALCATQRPMRRRRAARGRRRAGGRAAAPGQWRARAGPAAGGRGWRRGRAAAVAAAAALGGARQLPQCVPAARPRYQRLGVKPGGPTWCTSTASAWLWPIVTPAAAAREFPSV